MKGSHFAQQRKPHTQWQRMPVTLQSDFSHIPNSWPAYHGKILNNISLWASHLGLPVNVNKLTKPTRMLKYWSKQLCRDKSIMEQHDGLMNQQGTHFLEMCVSVVACANAYISIYIYYMAFFQLFFLHQKNVYCGSGEYDQINGRLKG